MSEKSSSEASFGISITGNASAVTKDIASSARLAAKSIGEYENEVKTLSSDLRRLRGNSEEVATVKAALKKRIDEAKQGISTLTTALAKQGTTYTAAAAAAKKYGDGVGRLPNLRRGASQLGGAIGKALEPATKKAAKTLEPAAKKLGELFAPAARAVAAKLAPATTRLAKLGGGARDAIKGLGKAAKEDAASVLPSLGSALGVVATGAAAAAAAVAAVSIAVVGGVAALAAFGLAAAASAAKMQRQREALLGNAEDARRMGDQIGALAGKVPQSVEEINALSIALSKTRLSGRAMVDTMNAVAQVTGAVDASAGARVQELLTRGQHTGRFSLGRRELDGTGIDFDDVAKAYAEGTKKSLAAARAELTWGKASLEQGAEALRKATEKKFGALNIQNAFSLENAPKKFFDQLKSLSSGVDLSPITSGLQSAFGELSPDKPLGAAVKTFMEAFGSGVADIAGRSIPVLVEGIKWLLVWGLRLGTTYYETKKKIQDAFSEGNWVGIGSAIVNGVLKGILLDAPLLEGVRGLAGKIKSAFTGEMEIKSPSRVFARYGEHTTEGYAIGVDRGADRASRSLQEMVDMPAPRAGAPSASAGAAGDGIGELHLHFYGVSDTTAQSMQSPEFLAQLTRAIRDAATARGVAVPAQIGVAA
ncbi:MAG: hypothetical protein KF764_08595 [Labilithrix sp.]|nr:hypothetical protein [Labilithrix sp.]